MKRLLALSAAVAAATGLFLSRKTDAATDTGIVTVTASVSRACQIDDSAVPFGTYDPFTANSATGIDLDATGTITLRCTGATPWKIGIDSGTSGTRTMVDPGVAGSALPYELYRDAGYSQVWGDADPDREGATMLTQGSTTRTIYGRIVKGLTPLAGLGYTQTLTATIEF